LYFSIAIEEVVVVASEAFDFFNQIVLVRFGVRLIDAFVFTLSTSATGIWSNPVTLEAEKQAHISLRLVELSLRKENEYRYGGWIEMKQVFLPSVWLSYKVCRPFERRFQQCVAFVGRHYYHYPRPHHHSYNLLRWGAHFPRYCHRCCSGWGWILQAMRKKTRPAELEPEMLTLLCTITGCCCG